MGVRIYGYSDQTKSIHPRDVADVFIVHSAGAVRIARTLGLDAYSDARNVLRGGSCTPDQFEEMIMRCGERVANDEYVGSRLISLARLVRDVRRELPRDAKIVWW